MNKTIWLVFSLVALMAILCSLRLISETDYLEEQIQEREAFVEELRSKHHSETVYKDREIRTLKTQNKNLLEHFKEQHIIVKECEQFGETELRYAGDFQKVKCEVVL